MSGVDDSVLRVAIVLKGTFLMCSGFRHVACAIGGVTLGARFAFGCVGDDAAAEQSLFTVSKSSRS